MSYIKKNCLKRIPDYERDEHGWILLSQSYPLPKHYYEVLELKFEDGFVQTVWWTGHIWDGGHKLHKSKPLMWRFKIW